MYFKYHELIDGNSVFSKGYLTLCRHLQDINKYEEEGINKSRCTWEQEEQNKKLKWNTARKIILSVKQVWKDNKIESEF